MKLTDMECIPCRGDQPKLTQEEIDHYLPQVAGWQVSTQNDIPRLTRQFKFKNFVQALAFANRVGDL
ncbi:MAG TPA: 4a-hydroxytetrahydrobiopterin dehydratase, partial [Anaerolineales bacterium]|nr:4a-hydroxytetrahydrobiopterin dehydratase [Anaerolineales bacterium]